MKEFRVRYAQQPGNHNPTRILFVEAATEEAAMAIALDHAERTLGFKCMTYGAEEVKPLPEGRVLP
jgi:hypothetical protein